LRWQLVLLLPTERPVLELLPLKQQRQLRLELRRHLLVSSGGQVGALGLFLPGVPAAGQPCF